MRTIAYQVVNCSVPPLFTFFTSSKVQVLVDVHTFVLLSSLTFIQARLSQTFLLICTYQSDFVCDFFQPRSPIPFACRCTTKGIGASLR